MQQSEQNLELPTVVIQSGQAVAQLVEALHYKKEGRGFDFPMVSLGFLIDIILSVALWP
jgi:hypothetical protein